MTLAKSTLAGTAKTAADARSQKVGGYSIDKDVIASIKHASKRTGVDFAYLMAQAAQESSFQADAKASTSSATGLYQFIDSTWMKMVKDHGGKHGLAQYADQIKLDGNGRYSVADPAMKRQILDLRKDPKVSAVLGAEFALDNKETLERSLGRKVGSTELYLAHFLGAGGATRFMAAIDRNGNLPAAHLLPDAAASNKSVFYDKETGKPRSVAEVFKLFSRSIERKEDMFAGLSGGLGDGVGGSWGAASRPGPTNFAAKLGPRVGTPGTATPGGSGTSGAGDSSIVADAPHHINLLTMLALAALDTANPSDAFGSDENAEEQASADPTAREDAKRRKEQDRTALDLSAGEAQGRVDMRKAAAYRSI